MQQVKELGDDIYEINFDLSSLSKSTDLLIIAAPKYNLKIQELKKIEEYIDKGGSLLVFMDVAYPVDNLNSLLSKYGLQFRNDFIVLPEKNSRSKQLGQATTIVKSLHSQHPITSPFAGIRNITFLLNDVRSLEISSNNIKGLTPFLWLGVQSIM